MLFVKVWTDIRLHIHASLALQVKFIHLKSKYIAGIILKTFFFYFIVNAFRWGLFSLVYHKPHKPYCLISIHFPYFYDLLDTQRHLILQPLLSSFGAVVIRVGSPIPGDVLEMEGMAFSFGCHSAWGWYRHLMGGDQAFMVSPCSTWDKPTQWRFSLYVIWLSNGPQIFM